ncbi:MAG: nucleotidyltransferase [Vulcanimicrobiaceae bacterium]
MSIRSIIGGLIDANVRFVVVGMAAGQLHGSRSLTEDVDVVYNDDAANVARLGNYLTSIGAYIQELSPNEGFAADFTVDRLADEKNLTLGSREGEIDVLHHIDGIGTYDEVVAKSQPLVVDGRRALVLSIDGLIISKRAAHRPKDLLHIPELESLRELLNLKNDPKRSPEL